MLISQADSERHKKIPRRPHRPRLRCGFNIDRVQTSERSELVGRLSQFYYYLIGMYLLIYVNTV